MTDDRALSEALGFVLVFSLIISSVGIAYVFGLGGLQDTRDYERVNNAERAFDVLADNVEDLSQRRAPSRATEIKLADARLTDDESVRVNLSVPAHGFSEAASVEPIVYESGTGTRLLYVGGAVIRSQPGGAIMVRTPDAVFSSERIVLPIIQTRAQSSGISGSTTVLVRTTVSKVSTGSKNLAGATAYINVTTERPDPWDRFLSERTGVDSCTQLPDGDRTKVSCELAGSVETVAGSVLKVDYTYSG